MRFAPKSLAVVLVSLVTLAACAGKTVESNADSRSVGRVDGVITGGSGCPTTVDGFHGSCTEDRMVCNVELAGECADLKLTYTCWAPGGWYEKSYHTTRCGCPEEEPVVGAPCDRPLGLGCAYKSNGWLPPGCLPESADNVAPFVGVEYRCDQDARGAKTWSRSSHCPYHNDPHANGWPGADAGPDSP